MKTYDTLITSKYKLYSGMLNYLPFSNIHEIGILIPLFHKYCQKCLDNGETPQFIVDNFEKDYLKKSKITKEEFLKKIIKYIERQVVLFDAIEDAAFNELYIPGNVGTLENLQNQLKNEGQIKEYKDKLEKFALRIVLTAHPTQFYNGEVLGILDNMANAVKSNDIEALNESLLQLGYTSFFKPNKPTPVDEASSLIWYLENVFYNSISNILDKINEFVYKENIEEFKKPVIVMGFWPGGDKDGNHFVEHDTTKNVVLLLKKSILNRYLKEIAQLKRKYTFKLTIPILKKIEKNLSKNRKKIDVFPPYSLEEFKSDILKIRKILIENYQSFEIDKINSLYLKVVHFGYYFASMDIRQNSKVLERAYKVLDSQKDNEVINFDSGTNEDRETLLTFAGIKEIQGICSPEACQRFIISNCRSEEDVLQVLSMSKKINKIDKIDLDIVPLFETVEDLKNSTQIMESLYKEPEYKKHLSNRKNVQTIMLGFSDGTKDGGYLQSNFSINQAKKRLSVLADKYDIRVMFFDGRGGPPARGGGFTHQFYSALDKEISNHEIQLTVQGQTISSNFGTNYSAMYNIEQLLTAGISNKWLHFNQSLDQEQQKCMEEFCQYSYEYYLTLKNHPQVMEYLESKSVLKYYEKTNIGSRPVKRNNGAKFEFKDLRAIPFVSSWSMLKQNVPGFFGIGFALQKMEKENRFHIIKDIFAKNQFFKTLIHNCMMAMCKTDFRFTEYFKNEKQYSEIWNLIKEEYDLSYKMILKLSDSSQLMQNAPNSKKSISIREEIIVPLIVLQRYAIDIIEKNQDHPQKKFLEKLITRSMFGAINASRNSV